MQTQNYSNQTEERRLGMHTGRWINSHNGDAGKGEARVPPLAQRRALAEGELHPHGPARGDVVEPSLLQIVEDEAGVENSPQKLDVEEVSYVAQKVSVQGTK